MRDKFSKKSHLSFSIFPLLSTPQYGMQAPASVSTTYEYSHIVKIIWQDDWLQQTIAQNLAFYFNNAQLLAALSGIYNIYT